MAKPGVSLYVREPPFYCSCLTLSFPVFRVISKPDVYLNRARASLFYSLRLTLSFPLFRIMSKPGVSLIVREPPFFRSRLTLSFPLFRNISKPGVSYAQRMGQLTQRATNYTARSNIEPAQICLHANGQSAPRSGGARDVGRGAGSHTPITASESFSLLPLAFDRPVSLSRNHVQAGRFFGCA